RPEQLAGMGGRYQPDQRRLGPASPDTARESPWPRSALEQRHQSCLLHSARHQPESSHLFHDPPDRHPRPSRHNDLPGYKHTLIPRLHGTTTTGHSSDPAPNRAAYCLAGTGPTNAPSPLRLQPPPLMPPAVALPWSSVTNRAYFIQRATTLAPTSDFSLLQS